MESYGKPSTKRHNKRLRSRKYSMLSETKRMLSGLFVKLCFSEPFETIRILFSCTAFTGKKQKSITGKYVTQCPLYWPIRYTRKSLRILSNLHIYPIYIFSLFLSTRAFLFIFSLVFFWRLFYFWNYIYSYIIIYLYSIYIDYR